MSDSLRLQRHKLVEELRRQGIKQPRVLDAIGRVRREAFVPADSERLAYRNAPLPIGHGQTISQPYIVALMAEVLDLQSTDQVLDVGTGSGYAAAVLSILCAEVYSIERFEDLAVVAKGRLTSEGFQNVHVRQGDGRLGWPEWAPFDAIAVAAGASDPPPALLDQLAIGGRMVIPLGDCQSQQLVLITRVDEERFDEQEISGVRFVPLVESP